MGKGVATKLWRGLRRVATALEWLWWGVVKPMGTPLKGLRATLGEEEERWENW